MRTMSAAVVLLLMSTAVRADSSTLDAAIGGGIGGAAGAAIGNEVGGREGAIAGSALGAAVGTALNTDSEHGSSSRKAFQRSTPASNGHPHYRFCPPGQAKKGRC
jgi:outer membrane lipoprotein SlyB